MALQVSVIITAYNIADYIHRAVMSALSQKGVELEVIVVDDASRDETLRVVSRIRDERVRVIALEKNQGPGAARNQGLAAAQGEWVAILDGDDAFAPGRLEALLERGTREGAHIVCDNLLGVDEKNTRVMFAPAELAANSPLTPEHFIACNRDFISGFGLGYLKPMMRTGFLRGHNLKYDETIRIGEDYLLLLEALLNEARCVLHPEPLYHYTRRAGSTSYRLTMEAVARIEAQDAALLSRYPLSEQAGKAQSQRTRHLREAYHYNTLVEALKNHRWAAAAQTFVTHPLAARHLTMPIRKRLGV